MAESERARENVRECRFFHSTIKWKVGEWGGEATSRAAAGEALRSCARHAGSGNGHAEERHRGIVGMGEAYFSRAAHYSLVWWR